ncbi:hypothetical protein [Bdellovibrio sp.]
MLLRHTIARVDQTSILELNTATFITVDPLPFTSIEEVLRRSDYCIELKLKEPTTALFSFILFRYRKMQDNFTLLADVDELDSLCQTLTENGVAVCANTIPDDDPTKQYTIVVLILIMTFLVVLLVEKLTT